LRYDNTRGVLGKAGKLTRVVSGAGIRSISGTLPRAGADNSGEFGTVCGTQTPVVCSFVEPSRREDCMEAEWDLHKFHGSTREIAQTREEFGRFVRLLGVPTDLS
jgi:hypothetical protein